MPQCRHAGRPSVLRPPPRLLLFPRGCPAADRPPVCSLQRGFDPLPKCRSPCGAPSWSLHPCPGRSGEDGGVAAGAAAGSARPRSVERAVFKVALVVAVFVITRRVVAVPRPAVV